MPETVIFYAFAALAIGASALVIGQRNPMYSVLLLVLSFAAIAGLFVQLDAPFLALALMIVYAGAIMVLFLFVVMLLNLPTETPPEGRSRLLGNAGPRHFGAVLSFALIVELAWALRRVQASPMPAGEWETSVNRIGLVLFRDYAFAFEATSVLILVAMVGAIVLARREEK